MYPRNIETVIHHNQRSETPVRCIIFWPSRDGVLYPHRENAYRLCKPVCIDMRNIRHNQRLVTPVHHSIYWPSRDGVTYPLQENAYQCFVETHTY